MADDLRADYFALFSIPRTFAVDAALLESRRRELQERTHPDRHAGAGAAERLAAEQASALVNEAYRTLKSPVQRAAYLTAQAGFDPFRESNTAMPPEFLVEQMEWRERLEDASGDTETLDELGADVARRLADYTRRLCALIDDDGDMESACAAVREMRYFEKLGEEVAAALEETD